MIHALYNAWAHGHFDWWLHHMPVWPRMTHAPIGACNGSGVCW